MRGGRKKTGKSTFSSSTSVSSTSPSTSGVSGGPVGWRGIIISNDGTPCVDGRLALGPCRRTRRRRALMKALPWILERKRFITKSHEQHCPSFTQSPSPPRSLVRDGQTSPHSPRLVVSRSTCPPLSTLLSHTIPFPGFTSVWWSD